MSAIYFVQEPCVSSILYALMAFSCILQKMAKTQKLGSLWQRNAHQNVSIFNKRSRQQIEVYWVTKDI